MIATGGCRGNGSQLADYLQDEKGNDRCEVIAIVGTSVPHDLKKSLIEMSLTCELSGRTDAGLYHAQLSPRVDEAAAMTREQKLRMAEIFSEHMGLDGHRFALVEQEKDGRIHYHMGYERYNHETGKMWDDNKNYQKHKAASRAMELEFGWEITHEKTNRLDKDIKAHLTKLWKEHADPALFRGVIGKAGFELVQGIGRRPYELVDRHGTVHDLARQLDGVRQKEVAERLNQIRSSLRKTTEASKEHRREDQQQENSQSQKSDKSREVSDSQDLMSAMISHYRQRQQPEQEPIKYKYGFSFKQPLNEVRENKQVSPLAHLRNKSPETSDKFKKMLVNSDEMTSNDKKISPLEELRKSKESPLSHLRPNNDNEDSQYQTVTYGG